MSASSRQSRGDYSLTGSNADQPNLVAYVVITDPRNLDADGNNRFFLRDAWEKNTVLGTFGTSARRFFHGRNPQHRFWNSEEGRHHGIDGGRSPRRVL